MGTHTAMFWIKLGSARFRSAHQLSLCSCVAMQPSRSWCACSKSRRYEALNLESDKIVYMSKSWVKRAESRANWSLMSRLREFRMQLYDMFDIMLNPDESADPLFERERCPYI
jgi:hypothetical protein